MRPGLLAEKRPVILAGDWNVVVEDRDVFLTAAMAHDALMQPETRAAWRRILTRAGPTRCGRCTPRRIGSTPSGTIPPAAGSAMPVSGSTTCC
jgi:hypothetical protein